VSGPDLSVTHRTRRAPFRRTGQWHGAVSVRASTGLDMRARRTLYRRPSRPKGVRTLAGFGDRPLGPAKRAVQATLSETCRKFGRGWGVLGARPTEPRSSSMRGKANGRRQTP